VLRGEGGIAWPHRHELRELRLEEGATVADAVRAAGLGHEDQIAGYAVFGAAAAPETRLHDGDRVELLRPLVMDPKEARRRRAAARARR